MKRYTKFLWSLLRHKWFVLLGCKKMKVPFYLWIWHDISKFNMIEFIPYARQFRNRDGSKRNVRNKDGSYDPAEQAVEFRRAWLHHQRNKHHWQAWCVIGDGGKLDALPMPEKYVREMIADWIGAGMAYNNRSDPRPWWEGNKGKMVLHKETLDMVEGLLKEVEW